MSNLSSLAKMFFISSLAVALLVSSSPSLKAIFFFLSAGDEVSVSLPSVLELYLLCPSFLEAQPYKSIELAMKSQKHAEL